MITGIHQDTLFVALTVVIIIITILMSSDAITVLVLIGLLIGLALGCAVFVEHGKEAVVMGGNCGGGGGGGGAGDCGDCGDCDDCDGTRDCARGDCDCARDGARGDCGDCDCGGTRDCARARARDGDGGPRPQRSKSYVARGGRGRNVQVPRYPGAIDDKDSRDGDHTVDGDYDDGRGRIAHASTYLRGAHEETNDDLIDGDERMVYQSRSRNDPTRAIAGTMDRRRELDKYLREEVEEEENRVWWGRHED